MSLHRFEHHSPLLDDDLVKIVRKLEFQYPNGRSSFTNGWCSPRIVQNLEDAAVGRLLALIQDTLQEISSREDWRINVWASVLRTGEGVAIHDHGRRDDRDASWAGVYYPAIGSNQAGRLIFPELGRIVEPAQGLLLVFPAATLHSVETCQGPGPQISLAFTAQ